MPYNGPIVILTGVLMLFDWHFQEYSDISLFMDSNIMEELGLSYPLNDSDSDEENKATPSKSSQEGEGEEEPFVEEEGVTAATGKGESGKKVEKVKVRDNTSLDYKLLDDLYIADQNNPIHQQYSELEMPAKAGKSSSVMGACFWINVPQLFA